MKNTLIQKVISNFKMMEGQHFLDWFKESQEWMLEKEKQQLIDAGNSCAMKQYLHEHRVSEMTNDELLKFVEQKTDTFGEDYYNETFNK